MFSTFHIAAASAFLTLATTTSIAEVRIVSDRLNTEDASPAFSFERVAGPSRRDAAASGNITVLSGRPDPNSGGAAKLNDDKLPGDEDEPRGNFFFAPGTDGGRVLLDLETLVEVHQVNTYSWHPGSRGPQVYELYGLGTETNNSLQEVRQPGDPVVSGWKLIAKVDTRASRTEAGGQYAVGISGGGSPIGSFRYLLFDIHRTEKDDAFGNTFYSEIDVLDGRVPEPLNKIAGGSDAATKPKPLLVEAAGGKYTMLIDYSETPDLADWIAQKVAPMAREWYPKIAELLASQSYEAPGKVNIRFSESMRGVAATSGTRITCAAGFIRNNLQGEAVGAIFHELVHVVQNYGLARRANPNPTRPPGWLVEGIADYLRWFVYEPQSKGAEISGSRVDTVKYSDSYRVSANFLNWVTQTAGKQTVPKLNAAMREGVYQEELWKEYTGRSLEELGKDWKKTLAERNANRPPSS